MLIYKVTRLEELRRIRDCIDNLIDRIESGRDLPPKGGEMKV